jgi:hypothetical protein
VFGIEEESISESLLLCRKIFCDVVGLPSLIIYFVPPHQKRDKIKTISSEEEHTIRAHTQTHTK